MDTAFIKKHYGFILLLLFVIGWCVLLYFISPEKIISVIGVETGYLLIFLTALIGISGWASAPFYTSLAILSASGNLNPFILILITAPARTVGDVLFFVLGHKGHNFSNELANGRLRSFFQSLNKQPGWVIPLVAYLYTSVAPLPKEFLMIILGLGKVHFRWTFIAVLLGNATFILLVYLFSVNFL